jgi:serine/threonine-protein kinase HipA
MTQKLNIWMNGIPVGYWERTRNKESFGYFPEWINHEQGRPLSLSLPFTPNNQIYQGVIVANFFDNLLPDSDIIRRRLAQRYQTHSVDPFHLLTAIGRDCVGAIQLLPPNEIPNDLFSIKGKPLNESEIAALIRNSTVNNKLFQQTDDDLRISIAGAQEKTALLWHNNQWILPEGNTPTTHIFKLPLGLVGNEQADMRTSVENEWLCAKLVEGYGLEVAQCEIGQFEEQKVLIVKRFDRKLASDHGWIVRLPQEDFCQALGVSPLNKYQRDGGVGIKQIMAILNSSNQRNIDKRNFFKSQVLFWLLAANDGHGKNFSIFHLPHNKYYLTPFYDILSFHLIIGTKRNQLAPQKAKLAMAVDGYYLLHQIQRRHWIKQAQQVGLGEEIAQEIIEELINATDNVLTKINHEIPAYFPHDLVELIFNGIRKQCKKISSF